MRFRVETKRGNNFLDITPVVDTVFNLLIFFALSLNFVSTPGIRVNLPKSSAAEIARDRKDIRVTIRSSGEVYVAESPVDLKGLADRFRKAANVNIDTQVLIQADAQVTHGKVVEVMDLARQAGLHRLAIVTRPREKSR